MDEFERCWKEGVDYQAENMAKMFDGDLVTIQGLNGVYVVKGSSFEPYKIKPNKKQAAISNKPAYANISTSGHF